MISQLPTISHLAGELDSGRTTSRALVEQALACIDDPAGEGSRTFIRVYREAALAAADASDRLRSVGIVPSPLAGLPISIKDLFDVKGDVTLAGSKALRDAPAAQRDSPVVARLRAAGAIIIGRTNLSEFAYSPFGINPHYGTPVNPHDSARVPGGSSSGAGVSVAQRMSVAAIGSDTGGSIRIPAAFCGVTGFKPTQARVPLEGTWPLSFSLDSAGPLAASVACCAMVDAALAGEPIQSPELQPIDSLRFAVPATIALEGMDATVADAFERVEARLKQHGASVTRVTFDWMAELVDMASRPTLSTIESYAWHRKLLAEKGDLYDPRIRSRIQAGAQVRAADYLDLCDRRKQLIEAAARTTDSYTAVLMPTIPIVAPRIDDVVTDAGYFGQIPLIIRNTWMANFLDRCALSLPVQLSGKLPAGIMLMGAHGADRHLLAAALAVEKEIAQLMTAL
jgi:aspartyl-tRNA(Asn)/glutamyl-tRNA(Gln) amidotransferase subunit A